VLTPELTLKLNTELNPFFQATQRHGGPTAKTNWKYVNSWK